MLATMWENYILLWNGTYGVINQVYMVFWHFVAIPVMLYIASMPIRYGREWMWLYPLAALWMFVFYWIGIWYG